jgi:IS30 family transposase
VRSAGWTAEVAINQLDNLKDVLHTITSDNGLEFAQHELISNSLDIDFYFAHRYKSYQRGSNENLNGLLRQYIPKKTDLTKVSKEDLENYCKKINDRPRKRYGYRSPTFIMKQELKLLGVAFIT